MCKIFFLLSANFPTVIFRLNVATNILLTINYAVSRKKCHYFVLQSCYNFDIGLHESIWVTFGRNITQNVSNQKILYFLPHLTSASALPEERGNPEIPVFHLMMDVVLSVNTKKHIKISLFWSQLNHPSL